MCETILKLHMCMCVFGKTINLTHKTNFNLNHSVRHAVSPKLYEFQNILIFSILLKKNSLES